MNQVRGMNEEEEDRFRSVFFMNIGDCLLELRRTRCFCLCDEHKF